METGCWTRLPLCSILLSTKKDVLDKHGLFAEGEYHKSNTYLRIGCWLNYFQKFEKLLLEPRINIRQQLSSEFALNWKANLKTKPPHKWSILKMILVKRRWVLVNNESIPLQLASRIVWMEFYKTNWMLR
jgi:hypothetical protein